MKKLSEYHNEEAIDLLADLLEPVANIFGDKKIANAINKKKGRMEIIKLALKSHKKDVIEAMAILEGVPVSEYDANLPKMTMNILELLSDKDMIDFFTSQAQMSEQTSSGSAMESIKEVEK